MKNTNPCIQSKAFSRYTFLSSGETFLFVGLRILLKKNQVGRSKKIKKKHIVFQDCHNDNMSQQYLESKFTWRVLHVRTPN
jgi:uncharacterized protein (DUF488 family)